jgi:hypothetical protein
MAMARFLSAASVSQDAKLDWRLAYHPYTATGKLKADNTATTPKGFGTVLALIKHVD